MERLHQVIAALAALKLLAACGGAINRNQPEGSGGSASSAALGGSATVGSAGDGAPAGAGGEAPVMSLDSFETPNTFASIGLWMGFPGDTLPIGTPPTLHDGTALHLVGTTDAQGLDVFFHTGMPVEKIWSSVRFWTQSDQAGSKLTIAIAGPEPSYFQDRVQGVAWPERVVTLSSDWQQVVVDFKDLGIGPDHLSPRSGPFGAIHFIVEANTGYDLWIDDLAGQPLYR